MKKFKIGDRVRAKGTVNGVDLTGKTGIIVCRGEVLDWGVKFDEKFDRGHTCNGHCEDGYGRFGDEKEFERIPKYKFKVGDKVIGNAKASEHYCITRAGWYGTVTEVKNDRDICVDHYRVDSKYFDLVVESDRKIVITSDGTTTLARLYDGKKVIKSAEAKCSPDDTFDFDKGAKIAFERLIGEGKTKTEDGIEIGKKYWLKPYDEVASIGLSRETWDAIRKKPVTPTNRLGGGNYQCDTCYNGSWIISHEALTEHRFNTGDKVKIIQNTCCHSASIGDIITLTDHAQLSIEKRPAWHYERGTTRGMGYIVEEDIEPYEEPTYKVGDRVVVTGCTCGHGYRIGERLTLKATLTPDEREQRWKVEEGCWYIRENDFKPLTNET